MTNIYSMKTLTITGVVALVLVACGGGGETPTAGADAQDQAMDASEMDGMGSEVDGMGSEMDGMGGDDGDDHAAKGQIYEPVEGAPEVELIAVDIDFEPATLELGAGEPVNVTVTNEGETLHDFTLDVADVHVNVEPGESKTTSITIDEPGSYEARCTVPGHAEAGMTVDVTVT